MGDPVDVREEVRAAPDASRGSLFRVWGGTDSVSRHLSLGCRLTCAHRICCRQRAPETPEGPRSQIEESCKPQCVKALLAYQVSWTHPEALRRRDSVSLVHARGG